MLRVEINCEFYLQRYKHEVYPNLGVPGPHREISLRIQTVLAPALAGEMQLGRLLLTFLLDGTLSRGRHPQRHHVHVRLYFVQVFLAEVLDGVTHRVRLKHAHPLVLRGVLVGVDQCYGRVVGPSCYHRGWATYVDVT